MLIETYLLKSKFNVDGEIKKKINNCVKTAIQHNDDDIDLQFITTKLECEVIKKLE